MRVKLLTILMLFVILMGLVGVGPAAAQAPEPPAPEPLDVTDAVRKATLDLGSAPSAGALGRQASPADYAVGDIVTWMGLNNYTGYYYFKDYELRAVGTYGEIWVALDINWPAGDPRANPVILDEQIAYLIEEFDTNIYPLEQEFFGTPDEHTGANSLLAAWGYVPPGYYDGDKVVILIDNVRDDNYYDSAYPYYIAGFYSPSFEAYFDRNVMTIDTFEWENRVGPDDSSWRGPDPGRWRPYLYEGTFAHEFQHLIHDDLDPDEELWLNEGMSDFAEWLCGYGHPDSHVSEFLSHAENSLLMWEDQGDLELLADYGIVYLWTLYLYEHFGGGPFIQAIAQSETNSIDSVDEALCNFGFPATFADVFRDFRIALLIDSSKVFKLPAIPWHAFGRGRDWVHPYEFRNIDVQVNLDTGESYDSPGAPPWGTDYIRIDNEARLKRLDFDGLDATVFDTPWTSDGDVLWSGTGDLLDNWAIFEAVGGGTLQFDTYWEMEAYWDFGFVQVSTDGGATWTSLADNEGYSTWDYDPSAHPKVIENLPGLTGTSDDWVTLTYDLSAYAGQDILIAFRMVTDWATHEGGWWIDNVCVDGTPVSDGSNVEPFKDITYYQPIDLDFAVTLVGVYEKRGKTQYIVHDVYLDHLTEDGIDFLLTVIRNGGYGVLLVTLEVPQEHAYFYGPYDYTLRYLWE